MALYSAIIAFRYSNGLSVSICSMTSPVWIVSVRPRPFMTFEG